MSNLGASGTPVKARRFFNKIRDWTWIKHTIFSDYVWPWAMKVGLTAPVIYIVDGFAGRGSYVDEETGDRSDGSPVIAALHARRYNAQRPGRRMRLICIERDHENYKALAERMAGFVDVASVRHGSFGDLAPQIAAEIGDAPTLVLIDPIGLKAIGSSACNALTHRKGKTDIFVIVDFIIAYRAAGQLLDDGSPDPRYPGAAALAENVDDFFGGTREWFSIIRSDSRRSAEVERKLIDLYFDKVLGGRFRHAAAYPVRRNYTAPPRYWIVNAADVLDAFELFNDEIFKIDRELYIRTYGENALPGIAEGMYERELETRTEHLRTEILAMLEDAGAAGTSFGALYETMLREHFGRVRTGTIKKAVKGLVQQKKLTREKSWWNAALTMTEVIKPAADSS